MMIVGGSSAENLAELLDFSGQNRVCPEIPNCPLDSGSVGVYIDGKALVCGGFNGGQGSDECYEFDVR